MPSPDPQHRGLLHTLLTGVAMGAADVVPGVSGGTVALLCGVYSRLLRAISRFDRQLLRSLRRKNWGNAAAQVDVAVLMKGRDHDRDDPMDIFFHFFHPHLQTCRKQAFSLVCALP